MTNAFETGKAVWADKSQQPDPLTDKDPARPADAKPNGHDKATELAALLSVRTWANLDIPPERKLLGDLITETSRGFFSGYTGIGKTLFAHALGGGMASGQGFLHWRAEQPSRCLIIDGEMSTALIKARSLDLIRRLGDFPPENLMIYSLDRAEEFAKAGLGMLAPLNTDEGQRFIKNLVDILKPDSLIFDNVMSLLAGDQKDELTWSQAIPLVQWITNQKKGQTWLDHTGHNSQRQYGTNTKSWRMDTSGLILPIPDEERQPGEVAFKLDFNFPGKARRRTPDNWHQFETCTIRLHLGEWKVEGVREPRAVRTLSPQASQWHRALLNALCRSDQPNITTRTAWFGEAVLLDLVGSITDKDKDEVKERKTAMLRKYIRELRDKGLIAVNGDVITYLPKPK
jgi:hypothetical protein